MAKARRRKSPPAATPKGDADARPGPHGTDGEFPVVGIGASAGGLEALKQLLPALPTDTGMAFVVVQHMAPSHESLLAEILSRSTSMPVEQVVGEPAVRPNRVYVIPPDRTMLLHDGHLRLVPRPTGGPHHSVDAFLRTLAATRGHRSIGVVLSGAANDGTAGLAAVKAEGGVTFAQDSTAKHPDMPRSAVAAGCVDFVLPPEEIAKEIGRIARHPYVAAPAKPEAAPSEAEPGIAAVLTLLHDATGVDFGHYRPNTLRRRITRRMLLHRIDGLMDYVRRLKEDPEELESLHQDVLIGVTSFFRDPEAYVALRQRVFPLLAKGRGRDDPIRVWVVGCSTGEEAYSIAIVFAEFAEALGRPVAAQIFATDLNAVAVEKARAGLYARNIEEDVSSERLARFFVATDGRYRIAKSVRDMCIFARHDAVADPPFSRMDLVSCRNCLIYMDGVLQERAVSVFQYALRPGGFLWLGASETVGGRREFFDVLDGRNKIFVRKPVAARMPPDLGFGPRAPIGTFTGKAARARAAVAGGAAEVQKQADRILLTRYAPPAVLVSSDLEILHFRGDTTRWLAPAQGMASLHLLKMAREGLLVPLQSAVHRAKKSGAQERENGVRVKTPDGFVAVDVVVLPVRDDPSSPEGFLVLFEERGGPRAAPSRPAEAPAEDEAQGDGHADCGRQILQLTQELSATREYLQSVIEQQEEANEDLQSANEEVQSSNEELQSINEEIETSKEEIQSSNEELATVNEELATSNAELAASNDDLLNLISGVQMPIVMLDRDLRIRRLTPAAERTLNLIPADVGRPIADINLPVDVPELGRRLRETIESVAGCEIDATDKHGRRHQLRLRPYRTLDGKVEGVVFVLVDVDSLKRAELAVRQSEERYRLLVDGAGDCAIVLLDGDGRVALWNAGAQRLFGWSETEILSSPLSRFFPADDAAGDAAEEVLRRARQSDAAPHERWMARKDGSRFWGSGVTSALRDADGAVRGYSEVIRDLSERKRLEDDLRRRVEELAGADRRKNDILAMVAHELRNPLAPATNALQVLLDERAGADGRRRALTILERGLAHMARVVEDVLDFARLDEGRVSLHRATIDLADVLCRAVEDARRRTAPRGQKLALSLPPDPVWIDADEMRLEQVFANLLDNAVKFSGDGAPVRVVVERAAGPHGAEGVVRVIDEGVGISAEGIRGVFEAFSLAEPAPGRGPAAFGIGLTLVKVLVELHGGSVEAKSAGVGKGAEFVVRLPGTSSPRVPRVRRAPGTSVAAKPRRILVVDDVADCAESLGLLLRTAGHEVRVALGGRQCFEALETFDAEVVLLDLGMPQLDGYEVARRLRARDGKKPLLVALTGYGQKDDRRKTFEAGFDEHLLKPTNLAELHEVFAARLGG